MYTIVVSVTEKRTPPRIVTTKGEVGDPMSVVPFSGLIYRLENALQFLGVVVVIVGVVVVFVVVVVNRPINLLLYRPISSV